MGKLPLNNPDVESWMHFATGGKRLSDLGGAVISSGYCALQSDFGGSLQKVGNWPSTALKSDLGDVLLKAEKFLPDLGGAAISSGN